MSPVYTGSCTHIICIHSTILLLLYLQTDATMTELEIDMNMRIGSGPLFRSLAKPLSLDMVQGTQGCVTLATAAI